MGLVVTGSTLYVEMKEMPDVQNNVYMGLVVTGSTLYVEMKEFCKLFKGVDMPSEQHLLKPVAL